jgi:hypothetical protein
MVAISRLLAFGLGLVLFVGCEQKGPMQKAGEKVDKAVEGTGKAIEKAGEKVKDATK